ncbi:cytidylyltransferase domain-containing protein [Candidatus Omnitrophota bacterium]
MRIVSIIQARMASTRLPKKILLDLGGKTVLEQVVSRARASKHIDEVVVATTVSKQDLAIVNLCSGLGISVYCGSEEDVLDRYYQTARLFNAQHIVRITSDCPVIDPKIVDDVIDLHLKEKADFTANIIKETFPDGQDVEVFTFKSLNKAWQEANLLSEREHVTPFIKRNPDIFKLVNLESKVNLIQKRWTLDSSEDYEFLKKVFEALYKQNPLFGMEEILKFIERHPSVELINQHIARNEGYAKSLKEDHKVSRLTN